MGRLSVENTARSPTSPGVEHPFHAVKRLGGFAKVRYRVLTKNTTHVLATCALANLYLVRHRLAALGT